MKTAILLTLLFIHVNSYSQRTVTIEKWEIYTKKGGIVIGADTSFEEAVKSVRDFKERNYGKYYEANLEQHLPSTVSIKKRGEDPLRGLFRNSNRGKNYFVLKKEVFQLFQYYNWKYHPDLVLKYDNIYKLGFTKSQEKVRAIIRYKIKGFQQLIDSY